MWQPYIYIKGNLTWTEQGHHTITLDLEWPSHPDFKARHLVKEQVGHMLLLNINRKAYMGSTLVRLHLTLVTLKGRSSFKGLYIIKERSSAILLLDTTTKPYVGSPMTPSHLSCKGQSYGVENDLKLIHERWGTVWELTQCFVSFSLQQWVFDTSLQKIASVIPPAVVKQSNKVNGPLCFFPK